MFYHHVLGWKACYTSFAAVLFKPTSRTELNVSIRSPSSEGGEILIPHQSPLTQPVSISSPSSEGGESYYVGFFCSPRGVSISSPSSEGGEAVFSFVCYWMCYSSFPLVLLQAKAVSGVLTTAAALRCSFH